MLIHWIMERFALVGNWLRCDKAALGPWPCSSRLQIRGDSGAREAIDACRYFATLLVGALTATTRKRSNYWPDWWDHEPEPLMGKIAGIAGGSFRDRNLRTSRARATSWTRSRLPCGPSTTQTTSGKVPCSPSTSATTPTRPERSTDSLRAPSQNESAT